MESRTNTKSESVAVAEGMAYTASIVSKVEPMVVNDTVPVTGAAHWNQMVLLADPEPADGSPPCVDAPVVVPTADRSVITSALVSATQY